MTRKFELTIDSNYVPEWTVQDAIRELFQNAIDQGDWSWTYQNGLLVLHNEDAALTPESLLLGNTSKRDDSSKIGQYGEGYKIACLVLVRAGLTVRIHTGDQVWTPVLQASTKWDAKLLTFFVTPAPLRQNLLVTVDGITQEQWEMVEHTNLYVCPYPVLTTTQYGQILSTPGRVFVNGLWVCDYPEYSYSYNFKPQYLRLGRDRQLVSDFDLRWLASRMWSTCETHADTIIELLARDSADVRYIREVGPTFMLSLIAYQYFINEHGEDAIPVSNQKEFDNAKSTHKPVIVNETYKNLLLACSMFKLPEGFFDNKLKRWQRKYGHMLDEEATEELEKIIESRWL